MSVEWPTLNKYETNNKQTNNKPDLARCRLSLKLLPSVDCRSGWLIYEHHVLSFKIFFCHHMHNCYLSTIFFVYFMASFVPFLLNWMSASQASCFIFLNFFLIQHIHERCYLSLFLFLFQWHLRFLVNGSWSHDKLSATYFVQKTWTWLKWLHCRHWMHFPLRKRFQTSPNMITAHFIHNTKPFFFFRINWDRYVFRDNWDSFHQSDLDHKTMFSGVGATCGKICVNSEYAFNTFLIQRETMCALQKLVTGHRTQDLDNKEKKMLQLCNCMHNRHSTIDTMAVAVKKNKLILMTDHGN